MLLLLRSSLRRYFLVLHLWLGLALGLYFSILGLTGSLLVFQDDLERLEMPEIVQVKPPVDSGAPLPLSTVMARVRSALPQAKERDLSTLLFPPYPDGAYRLRLNTQDPQTARIVTIDPNTGGILRNQLALNTPLGFARELHVNLLLKAPGEIMNGYGGLCLAMLLLSGLWVWWPASRRQWRTRLTVNRQGGVKRVVRDLHHVLGIYSFVLLLIICLTGSMFVFRQPAQRVIYKLTGTHQESRPPIVIALPGTHRLHVERLVEIAESIVPTEKISSISYPTKPAQPFSCYKRSFSPGFLPYVRIFIDPYTGKVLRIAADHTASRGEKVMRVFSMLHFGLWGALPVKIIYALVGLVPIGLYISGILMYFRKLRSKVRIKANQKLRAAII